MALVLTRKEGSGIILTVGEEEIFITIGRCRKSDTRLRITASDKVVIMRAEFRGKPVESEEEPDGRL